jgi:iron complex outermembrane receptor protein
MFMFKNFLEVEDISEELQFISTTDGPFEWVAGLYYYEGDPRSDPLFIIQNAPYDVTPSNILDYPGGSITMVDTAGKVKAKAVYGQAGYKVTDDTKITLGLRYTEEKRGYNYAVFGIGELAPGFVVPVLAPLDATTRPSETFKKLTWRLALDHNFTDDIMGYISYNRGFKSGVYNHSDFTPTQVAVRPEVLDAYEVGVKSKWLDHRVQVNAAAFYYDYKNIQVSRIDATTTATQTLENAAKEEIYGLDLDLVIQASEALQLRAGANWLHAKYTDFEDASGFVVDENGFVTPASINATGTRGILAPKFSFNIGADYRAALGNNGSLLFSGYVFYTDKYKTVVGEGNQVFSHALVNASVTWYSPDEKYYIRLSGENLTDKKVTATSTSPFRLARYEIQPISWGIAVGANF